MVLLRSYFGAVDDGGRNFAFKSHRREVRLFVLGLNSVHSSRLSLVWLKGGGRRIPKIPE